MKVKKMELFSSFFACPERPFYAGFKAMKIAVPANPMAMLVSRRQLLSCSSIHLTKYLREQPTGRNVQKERNKMSKTIIVADNGNTLVEPTMLINTDQLKALFPEGYDSTVNTMTVMDADGNDTNQEVYIDSPFSASDWILDGDGWTVGVIKTQNTDKYIYIKEAEGQGIVIDWDCHKSELINTLNTMVKVEEADQDSREDDDQDWTLYNKLNDCIEEIEEN